MVRYSAIEGREMREKLILKGEGSFKLHHRYCWEAHWTMTILAVISMVTTVIALVASIASKVERLGLVLIKIQTSRGEKIGIKKNTVKGILVIF